MALHAKAKAEAGYRFYALYDKISREDILAQAFNAGRQRTQLPRRLLIDEMTESTIGGDSPAVPR